MPRLPWIFKDNQHASDTDRNLLCGFLQKHKIAVEGHFRDALDNSGLAWKYPAFAVKHYPSDPLLIEKLRLLCQVRGNGNNVERHYQNQLVEFHALYASVALMGYRFEGWDKPSGKTGVDPQKNCDLALMRDGERLFADAKDVSSEIFSMSEIPGRPGYKMFDPKVELTAWVKRQISNVEEKGADFLICHTPGWELAKFGFNEEGLSCWLDSIFPNTLAWSNEGPVWQIDSGDVIQIIIIKREGCLKIRAGKV